MKQFGRRGPETEKDKEIQTPVAPVQEIKPPETTHLSEPNKLPENKQPQANDAKLTQEVSKEKIKAKVKTSSTSPVFSEDVVERLRLGLLSQIDPAAASKLSREQLQSQIETVIGDIASYENIRLNTFEQKQLTKILVDDMLGFGPLEPLLDDDSVNDILVNGPDQIYVEIKGKLKKTNIKFRDNTHVTNIAQRIANQIGRRIDESTPMADARLPDGSRVNIIMPPLSLTGTTISIRKFSRDSITLDRMIEQGNISMQMATVLKVAAACRLNVLISGGTGSGKTTLLNALSQLIDRGERIVTIEDAAELQLQQPHVVRLETRMPNLEGDGAVTIRDLLKNSLRMRPDRIIVGEVRGAEVLDMLQAMNTGHDGSMSTLHANTPRDALMRLENMASMASASYNAEITRRQIVSAVDLIIQTERMRDGMRRVTYITEIVGIENGIITGQDLFNYKFEGENTDGSLKGKFISNAVKPNMAIRATEFGYEKTLHDAMMSG